MATHFFDPPPWSNVKLDTYNDQLTDDTEPIDGGEMWGKCEKLIWTLTGDMKVKCPDLPRMLFLFTVECIKHKWKYASLFLFNFASEYRNAIFLPSPPTPLDFEARTVRL